jgi:hypothetical protein
MYCTKGKMSLESVGMNLAATIDRGFMLYGSTAWNQRTKMTARKKENTIRQFPVTGFLGKLESNLLEYDAISQR